MGDARTMAEGLTGVNACAQGERGRAARLGDAVVGRAEDANAAWSRRPKRLRCEQGHEAKRAEAALRAALNVEMCDALPEGADRFSGRGGARWGSAECGPSRCEQRGLVAVGEQAVVADAVEATRQHVESEAAQKLCGSSCMTRRRLP